ncbi:ABC transporter substrate-binding protein [Ensifer sp. YR511]|uniref:ABC transporter substrate-binding protein n=1 Tax=Ensifer sp. YR511 TaxID=1855294 RepID=UPI00088F6A42|nr:ABC transporter substrate-binding protein [Ensifer sp. YR511]SDN35679.1 ribose transport system substrate-binding protein [Ensifer sp. YR511]
MKTHLLGLLAGAALLASTAIAVAQSVELNPALQPADGTQTQTFEPSKKESFVIGLSNISVVNTWRVQMMEEAKHEATQHPEIKEMVVTDAGGDTNKQVADIEDLLARGIDALLVAPGSEVALNGVLDKAYASGIPVIIFSSNASPQNYTSKIIGDDADFGRAGAEFLAKTLGGKGNIIGIRGISGNSIDNDRWRGVEEALKSYPDIKIVDTAFGDWAYDKGKRVCESLLTAHTDLNGIWSSGGAMTQACAEVLNENGLPQIAMTGEGNNGFLRIWQEMDLTSIAPQYPTWFGQQAVIAALRVLKGEPVAKDYLLRPAPITKEEIAKYYRDDLNDSYWVGSSLPDETLKGIYAK